MIEFNSAFDESYSGFHSGVVGSGRAIIQLVKKKKLIIKSGSAIALSNDNIIKAAEDAKNAPKLIVVEQPTPPQLSKYRYPNKSMWKKFGEKGNTAILPTITQKNQNPYLPAKN